MKKILTFTIIAIFCCISLSACTSKSQNQDSHNNCMFIGYADPNRPLNGNTIISHDPKYGYKPVYVDRADIYNTYHFH